MDVDLDPQVVQIQKYVDLINSNSPEEMLEGTVGLRKILCIERSPPYDQVFATGVVPRLITFLDPCAPQNLQFESCWCISNLASGTNAHTKEIVDRGALLPLIKLISSNNVDVAEQSTWAIGNIAGDSPKYRDEALYLGVLEPLVETAQKTNTVGILRRLSWTISNLCRGTPQPPLHMVLPCLGTLRNMVYIADDEVLIDSIWAVSYITSNNEGIQCIIDLGIVHRMIELMLSSNHSIMIPALRTVGNIASGNDTQTQTIINLGVLPILFSLFTHVKKNVRKEAYWTASNIASGTVSQIQALIDHGYFPELLRIFDDPVTDITLLREIGWTISNASNGSSAQVAYFVQIGFIKSIASFLKRQTTPKDVLIFLEALHNILHSGSTFDTGNPYLGVCESEGIPTILSDLVLRCAEKLDVFEKIHTILDSFFFDSSMMEDELQETVEATFEALSM
ncbi:hypothetical protein CYY_002492 [Polysphondylium violaceum]|uniref:Importin subunit alpha n=1 Tax=Polysphondylium violaceum TaxID=133409 RepID=A0A8J4Q032_9MYCE|nr:hypothetical protein CYY_002492 [Polysphondylium violaceum]